MGAAGSISQGNANAAAANYNADIASQNAALTRAQGAENERKARVAARKQLGDMKASAGATGVSADSYFDVIGESAANAELDALNVRYDAESRATAYDNEARIQRFSAKQSKTAGRINAVSSLLGGTTQAYQMRRT